MDFNDLFAQFNTLESYRILAFLLVAFLLGLWVGRLTRRARIRRLERELEEKKKKLAELEAELTPLKEELDLKKADLKKISFDKEELEAKVQRLEADKAKLYREVHAINTELEAAKASEGEHLTKIDLLNAEMLELRQKNEALGKVAEKEDNAVDNMAQMQSVYNATRIRLEALEERMSKIDEENQRLQAKVDALEEQEPAVLSRQMAPAPAPVVEEEEEPSLEASFGKAREVMGQKIFVDEEQAKDDLTRIKVIGPFLEEQLNQIGVFTYEQIAEFDQATIDEVTKAIGYFPGRIEKDDWVGQAKKLLAEQEEGTGEAVLPVDLKLEDLKIVEGIGPKIEEILKNAGVHNLVELSEMEPDQIREILLAAGDRFKMFDPTTWPAQARLAKNGNWELLAEYQEQLKGGREVSEEEEK
jgi:predicted flap endonuclease-1-like 5' DNA nuclease